MAGARFLTGIVAVLALMLSWRFKVGWLGRIVWTEGSRLAFSGRLARDA